MKTFEYTGLKCTLVIQAPDIKQAAVILREKFIEEYGDHEDADEKELIDITSPDAGVIAFVNLSSPF